MSTKSHAKQRIESPDDHDHDHDHDHGTAGPHSDESRTSPFGWIVRHYEVALALAAGVVLMLAWLAERTYGFTGWTLAVLYGPAYVLGSWTLLSHTLTKLFRGRFVFDIDLLMILAAAGAATLGAFAEGGFLLFLFSLSHALEEYATGKARGAIAALADLAPAMARVRRDGKDEQVPVAEVRVGETVIVLPAERIAVDGGVASGWSAVNQAPITGESVPVDKAPGDRVFAGTVNGEGALEVIVTRAAGDRTLDRVIKLVSEARTQRAPTQVFTDRFQRIFVPMSLAACVLLIIIPPLTLDWAWRESFYRGMALLVAASPCALALGTPAAVLAGIAQAARNGVLIKGGEHLENLGIVRAIALDKTGTLTLGKPEVTDVVAGPGVQPSELMRIAGAVERRSQHPLARAIVRRAEADGLRLPEAGDVQSVTARGVRSTVEGKAVEIGSLRMWDGKTADSAAQPPAAVRADAERLLAQGRSIVIVRHGDRWLGVLGIADRPRPNARDVLNQLRAMNISRVVMLTGDNKAVGEAIGREVGVDEVRADLFPEDKVKAMADIVAANGPTAMVGDGVNDAPALANATVGIAMGGAGTAAALETADAALMGDDLSLLPFSVALARKARLVIRQNLYISLGVIVVLLAAVILGLARIGPVVIVHEGSTLVVLANALRLLAFKRSS